MKANQPLLYQGIALLFHEPGARLESTRHADYHGDRQEVRQLRVSSALNEWAEWPALAQVGELTHTWRRKGKRGRQVSYLITSLPRRTAGPRQLLQFIRGHWGIENRLHWVRDVTFDEDRCQIRTGAAPQVMAALRNLVIGMFRLAGASNIAAALREHAWQPYLALRLVVSDSG